MYHAMKIRGRIFAAKEGLRGPEILRDFRAARWRAKCFRNQCVNWLWKRIATDLSVAMINGERGRAVAAE
jgi:hypothetical protein